MFDNIKVFILMCLNKLGVYTKAQYEEKSASAGLLSGEVLKYSLKYVQSLLNKNLVEWELRFLLDQLKGQCELTDKLNLLVEALQDQIEDEKKKVEILTEQLLEKRKRK